MKGIHTALVTPFKNGKVDFDALTILLERQVDAGVDGIVLCATTGEGSNMTKKERQLVIKHSVERVNGIDVTVGTGSISPMEIIEANDIATDLGAGRALVSTPPYVLPSTEGVEAFYKVIADKTKIPVILYNIPSRTGCHISKKLVAKLSRHENICAIKEASGSIYTVQEIIKAAGNNISVLSGDDSVTLSLLVAGGDGVISTCSNVLPEIWVQLYKLFKEGEILQASNLQNSLVGMHEALFAESNPGPVKAALNMMGLIAPEVRIPLSWPTHATCLLLASELNVHGKEILESIL